MDTRTIADTAVLRPILDDEDLEVSALELAGQFTHAEGQAEDLDQAGVTGHGSLHHVRMSRSSLAESRLSDLELMDVSLDQVVVANAVWDRVIIRRVEMIGCQAIGWQLGVEKAEDLYLEDCRLDYSRINVEHHRGVIVFHRCTFKEAMLSGDLSGIVFSECEFVGAEFDASRAVRCDMTRSRLSGASGLLTLAGTVITEEQAMMVSGQLAAEAGFVIA
jgi:uncharacterized protein YjbI with pentapeptide repeats